MKLYIEREKKEFHLGILGKLYLKNEEGELEYICDTCENLEIGPERNLDLAIPFGVYKVGVHKSAKFKNAVTGSDMAVLFSDVVPKDRCILIHAGNSHKDTAGCILLGTYDDVNNLFVDSRKAVDYFYQELRRRCSWPDKEVSLEISDGIGV